MQVNATDDNISSVTLGQSVESKSFTISSNAAFFQTLSKSLYSMPELAVMREVICNSWDPHISAGITDKPVEVTTDNLTISFRDFGTGIPDELMSEIYATYGASTKTNDSRVTGGFGLGCKSPFAVTDNFQVVSYFGGKKSTYNVVLVDENTGLPSMSCIAQTPTDETGIEVSITLDSPTQVRNCLSHLEAVIRCGDIKARINGLTVVTLGLDFTEGSYTTIDRYTAPVNVVGTHVLIRYGNAIYPVDNDDAEVTRAVNILARLIDFTPVNSLCQPKADKILIQAAPNSISVAPSREVLSYQSLTKESLINLCLETVNVVMHKLKEDWKSFKSNMLTATQGIIESIGSYDSFRSTTTNQIQQYAMQKLSDNERKALAYMEKNKREHAREFSNHIKNHINKCMVKKLLTLDTPYSKYIALLVFWDNQGFAKTHWKIKNKKKLDKILLSKIRTIADSLPKQSHRIYDLSITHSTHDSVQELENNLRFRRYAIPRMYSILTYQPETYTVVLSVKANIDVAYRLDHSPDVKLYSGMWIHDVIPRKKSAQQERVKYWESKGHKVINLEDKHSWDPESKPKEVVEKTKAEDAYVTLFKDHLSFYNDNTCSFFKDPHSINTKFQLGNLLKDAEPKYYLSNLQNYEWFTQNLMHFDKSLLKDILKHTVVSKSAVSTNACKKLGLKPLHDLLDIYLMKGAIMHNKLKGTSEEYANIEKIHKQLRKLNLSFPLIKLLPKREEVNYTEKDLNKSNNIAVMCKRYAMFWRNSRERSTYPCANHNEVINLYGSNKTKLCDNKQLLSLEQKLTSSPTNSIFGHGYISSVAGSQEGDLLREYLKLILKRLKANVYAN